MRKIVFIILLISVGLNAQQHYFGDKRHGFVHATISDSLAIVDYCHYDSGNDEYSTTVDTLRLRNGVYINGKKKIKIKNGNFKLYPQAISLTKITSVDSSLFRMRTEGYSANKWAKLEENDDWIFGNKRWESIYEKRKTSSSYPYTPEENYKIIDKEIKQFEDSILLQYCKQFNKIRITDDKLLSKKSYLNSQDSAIIANIWSQLMASQVHDKFNLNFYQSLAIYLGLGVNYPILLFLGVIPELVFEFALYETEIFIADRFVSNKTYAISFYKDNKRMMKLRVRDNYIINNIFYKGKLSHPFNPYGKDLPTDIK